MAVRMKNVAILSALGFAAVAATVSAQTAALPAKPAKPAVPSASTAPSENEGEYLQKLRKLRRELYEVKSEVDSDKNQSDDENRKDFNAGINEAINAIDKEIVANKTKK